MSTPAKQRPLSPFMIGPYYKAQLTSMLSITHRATGVFLAIAALGLAWWLFALAAGPAQYERFADLARGIPGMVVALGLVFSLSFHFFNGIRHLLWDVGWGLDIPRTYATGWIVLVLSILVTLAAGWLTFAQVSP
jgi:succinate dehydrogenase / fumarate reductase, cytochrome b subunit